MDQPQEEFIDPQGAHPERDAEGGDEIATEGNRKASSEVEATGTDPGARNDPVE
jgi:hypothetical protein